MQTDSCVFDASRPIAINLRTPDGAKTVRVRFPSDDEWTARQRRRKVIVKNLGRGMSETTVAGGEEVEAALVAKIRVEEENPVEIDPFEATRIVEQLSQAEDARSCLRARALKRGTSRRPGRHRPPLRLPAYEHIQPEQRVQCSQKLAHAIRRVAKPAGCCFVASGDYADRRANRQ